MIPAPERREFIVSEIVYILNASRAVSTIEENTYEETLSNRRKCITDKKNDQNTKI